MAAVAPGIDSPAARAAAIQLMDPNFKGFLSRLDVPEIGMAKLALLPVRTVPRLAVVADDRAGIMQFCLGDLQLGRRHDRDVGRIRQQSLSLGRLPLRE